MASITLQTELLTARPFTKGDIGRLIIWAVEEAPRFMCGSKKSVHNNAPIARKVAQRFVDAPATRARFASTMFGRAVNMLAKFNPLYEGPTEHLAICYQKGVARNSGVTLDDAVACMTVRGGKVIAVYIDPSVVSNDSLKSEIRDLAHRMNGELLTSEVFAPRRHHVHTPVVADFSRMPVLQARPAG